MTLYGWKDFTVAAAVTGIVVMLMNTPVMAQTATGSW